MSEYPILLALAVLCVLPGILAGGGFAAGWWLRGRGGLPRLYWPEPEQQAGPEPEQAPAQPAARGDSRPRPGRPGRHHAGR